MSLGGHIKRNSLFAFLSQGIRLFTNAAMFIGIARFYGPTEFGQFTAAHTFSIVFLLVADFGFDILLTWDVARQRQRAAELAGRYLSGKIVFGTVAVLTMAAMVTFQSVSTPTRHLAYLFCFYTLVSTLTNFSFALFRGLEQFQHETRISLISNVVLLGLVFVLGFAHAPLIAIAAAFLVSHMVAWVLSLRVARSLHALHNFRFALPPRESFSLIAVFGLNQVFSRLFFTQDTLLLSMLRGDHDVGVYQAVFKIIGFLFIVPDVLFQTFLPTLSRLFVEDRERWQRVSRLLQKSLTFIGLPLAAALFLYPSGVIRAVYGPQGFGEAVPVLQIFAGVLILHFIGITSAIILISANRVKEMTMIVAAATVLNAVLNLWMIPQFGPFGAALVSLATMAFVATAYMIVAYLLAAKWVPDLRLLLPAACAGLAIVVLWSVRNTAGWIAAIPLLALYIVLIAFVGYSRQERQLLVTTDGLPAPVARLAQWVRPRA